MSYKVDVRKVNDVAIVELSGRITLGEGAGMLRDAIKDQVKSGTRKLLIDLKGVVYIDSAGLGELVGAYASITNAGGRIKLLNPEGKVSELLTMTKLYTVFEAFRDEAAAVASFSADAAGA